MKQNNHNGTLDKQNPRKIECFLLMSQGVLWISSQLFTNIKDNLK